MSEFKREERYVVIKIKDLVEASGDIDPSTGRSEAECVLRNFLEGWHIPTRECVVIEADWPEYEPAWQMIEDRVTGKEPEFVSSKTLCEHSGCGHGPQSNQVSFTIYRGDKLIMHRGKLGHIYTQPAVKP